MALPIVTFFQRVRPTDSFNFVTTRPERTTTTTTTTSIAIFSHSRFGQNTTTSMESQSVFFFSFLFLFLSLPSYLSSPRLPTVGVETQLILTVMLWNPIFHVPRKKKWPCNDDFAMRYRSSYRFDWTEWPRVDFTCHLINSDDVENAVRLVYSRQPSGPIDYAKQRGFITPEISRCLPIYSPRCFSLSFYSFFFFCFSGIFFFVFVVVHFVFQTVKSFVLTRLDNVAVAV